MHLTRVDLPAPLSPTSAVTSPSLAVKSTLRSTSTGPKLLFIPRNCMIGSFATSVLPFLGVFVGTGGRPPRCCGGRPPGPGVRWCQVLLDAGGRAERRVAAGAHRVLGRVLVVDRLGD